MTEGPGGPLNGKDTYPIKISPKSSSARKRQE